MTYRVQGRSIRPTLWSIKNQRAAHLRPIPDVHRGIGIRVRLISASSADVGMFFSIIDITASVARLGRVVRSDRFDEDAGTGSLVPDERFKLKERPVVAVLSRVSLCCLSLLRILPDAGQVLQNQSSAALDRHGDQFLADAVIDMGDNSALPGLQLFHRTVLSSFLQLLASSCEDAPDVPNALFLPENDGAFRHSGYDGNILTPINPDPAIRLFRIGNFHRHGETGVPDAFSGLEQFQASFFGLAFNQRIQKMFVRRRMDFNWNTLPDTSQQAEADTERIAGLVQVPVLIVRLQRQCLVLFCLVVSVCIADRLIDPCRSDLCIREILACELATFSFRQGQNVIGNLGVQVLESCKKLPLRLV